MQDAGRRNLERRYAPDLVYSGRFANASQVSPAILAAPTKADGLEPWLHGLFTLCHGHPMLSYVVAPTDLHLKAWLQDRAQVTTQETQAHYMVRYADTRCLPHYSATLTTAQQQAFFHGVVDWRYHNREGLLYSALPAAHATAPISAPSAVAQPFSMEQQQKLMALALPDTVCAYLMQRPEIFGPLRGQPSAVHARIAHVLQQQGNHGKDTLAHGQLQTLLQDLSEQGFLLPSAEEER